MSTGGGPAYRLNTDEVALVLRRAAELEAETTGVDPDQGFDAAVILDAAEEVGLSPVAVRQALVELRSGTLPVAPPGAGTYAARLAGPSHVVEARMVPSSPHQVMAAADEFFRRRAFEARRRHEHGAVYRERQDLWRHFRRVVDIDGARQLAGVQAVTMVISPLGDGAGPASGSMVRLEATLRRGRRGAVAMVTGYGVVGATGLVAVAAGDPTALVIGAPAGAAIGAGGLGRRRRWRLRRSDEIGDLLASLLDRLHRPG
ncbi:MAG: hypothetical protein ACRD2C_27375 [Acidimicrobiales bacterium]